MKEAADNPLPPTAENGLAAGKGAGAGAVPKALVVKPKLPPVKIAAGVLAGSALLPLPVATAESESRELEEEAAVDKKLGAVGAAVA